MTKIILLLLVGFLIVCAIGVSFAKSLLASVVIFMSYSLVMSIVWIFLESPDLAITEAAVGAGVTSVLFFVTLRKINAVEEENEVSEPGADGLPSTAEPAETGNGNSARGGEQ